MRITVLVLILVLDFSTSTPIELVNIKSDEICSNSDCIATSERVLKYMNLSVNPCDDFFQVINHIFQNFDQIKNDLKL